jgi:hypothetical protein
MTPTGPYLLGTATSPDQRIRATVCGDQREARQVWFVKPNLRTVVEARREVTPNRATPLGLWAD